MTELWKKFLMCDWAKSMQIDKANNVVRLAIYENKEKIFYGKNVTK